MKYDEVNFPPYPNILISSQRSGWRGPGGWLHIRTNSDVQRRPRLRPICDFHIYRRWEVGGEVGCEGERGGRGHKVLNTYSFQCGHFFGEVLGAGRISESLLICGGAPGCHRHGARSVIGEEVRGRIVRISMRGRIIRTSRMLDKNRFLLSLGRSGASILVPWGAILAPWEHPGGPWEQQARHLGVRNRIFIDFGEISGPPFESFSDTAGENPCFFLCSFSCHFLHGFLHQNLDRWSS